MYIVNCNIAQNILSGGGTAAEKEKEGGRKRCVPLASRRFIFFGCLTYSTFLMFDILH